MRIIFIGTPDFAVASLAALHEAGRDIVAVVTPPDKPRGRKLELYAPPVKQWALAHDLPVIQPHGVKSDEAYEQLAAFAPDLIVTAAYGHILPRRVLDLPPFGAINVHASLLPRYRGAAPIQRSIIDGCPETGVTIMYMDDTLDTGDIIVQRACPITDDDTSESLHDKLAAIGGALLPEAVAQIEAGTVSATPQDDALSSYAKPLTKAEARLAFDKTPRMIDCFVRGMYPWPQAWLTIDGKTTKILAVREAQPAHSLAPGQAINDGGRLVIGCSGGAIEVMRLCPEGKRPMTGEEFLRGGRALIIT